MSIDVRSAKLDDAYAISAAFQAQIGVWQRIGADGRVETVAHEDLSIYERWLHGGAWMSIETASIWLNHLLLGNGLARVAYDHNGALVGYVEAFHSTETDPFGRVLHLHQMMASNTAATRALLTRLADDAKALKCQRMTVTRIGGETPYDEFAELTCMAVVRRYALPARQGQVFYRAVDHTHADAAQISGWGMPVGRTSSARTAWETLWNRQFNSIPEIAAQKTQWLYLSVAGQEAYLYLTRRMYDPRAAEVAVWSPKPLTVQVVSAVRDWAHREGYRSLVMTVLDEERAALGAEADADGYSQETCSLTLRET